MDTFAEANKRLKEFMPDKLDLENPYSLDTIERLMRYLGNPQDKLRVLHVAGTSGKSSTAYYIANILKAVGKKVGLVVSPHIDEVNERVQVNATPLQEVEFCTELDKFLKIVGESGLAPSYFEVLTAFAYWEFVRSGMEYAVVEVGLGGLLDATNVVNREDKVCVIADIGIDHISRLGSTLAEIAAQKAGIIQLHNTVFCYKQSAEVMDSITSRARQKQATMYILDSSDEVSDLSFLPLFQRRNLGLARAAAERVLGQDVDEELIDKVARTYIPARMEEIEYGGRKIIIDGAHNFQKLHALGESLQHKYAVQEIAALVSFTSNRDYRLNDSIKELSGWLNHAIITNFRVAQDVRHRAESGEKVQDFFNRHHAKSTEVVLEPADALQKLLARPEPILLITGSMYLINHMRPLLKS